MADTIVKSYRYRIYLSKKQQSLIKVQFRLMNNLYNACLEQRILNYKHIHPKFTSKYDQINELVELKEAFPEYKSIHSQVLQNVIDRVDKAFKNYFIRIKKNKTSKVKTKVGFPRYKPYKEYKSFTFPQTGYEILDKDNGKKKLRVSKVGEMKLKLHRPIGGKIKECTLKKAKTNKWYATFVCECVPKRLPILDKITAFDLGVKHFITFSDGSKIDNPHFLKHETKELKKAQQKLSKTEKKSKEREERKKVVARVHERINNKKEDFLQKESRKIVNENGLIIYEKLNIKRMIEDNNQKEVGSEYNKSISEISWGIFTKYVSDKAEEAGREVEKVNPKDTSRMCSNCFNIRDITLDVRIYECVNEKCRFVIDRDKNAALNILRLGIESHNKKVNNVNLTSY